MQSLKHLIFNEEDKWRDGLFCLVKMPSGYLRIFNTDMAESLARIPQYTIVEENLPYDEAMTLAKINNTTIANKD